MKSTGFKKPWIPVHLADDEGLVGVGGDLSPETLLNAYADGVFPWFSEGDPILWWSPNPRAIIEYDDFHISKSLAKTIRKQKFITRLDSAFEMVMAECGRHRPEGTWINSEMLRAYSRMHKLGFAHSAEAWLDGVLVGGVYGVGVGGLFSAESMFFRETDASKVALAYLINHLKARGYLLVDVQIINDHTRSLGATEIGRNKYVTRVKTALAAQIDFLEKPAT
ncbi:leucyl/phenylalanyl-tRNA--protein transferase [Telmatocola sphagniphila]|uniref:Leucyl/phenylalanyl-tRNA--protein transferase n=1 Tax=Telmatocola sphagniphila TaxID=1123043 RepID=A0A8E6B784_9BACT|nr:leucyl/phenylalanyl-tRNA--protein transferase [Telmatocola sphagniphila]QVL32744.1 leucyl/phenylalanyl-tRNA--protein transferase [Telmatocola sphagniphila]